MDIPHNPSAVNAGDNGVVSSAEDDDMDANNEDDDMDANNEDDDMDDLPDLQEVSDSEFDGSSKDKYSLITTRRDG